MRGGRSPKRKGYYYEKRMEAALEPYGFKRMVMSGALGGDHAGDLRRLGLPQRTMHIVEVKRRAGQQRLIRRWLLQGGADCLVLPGDRGDFCLAVVSLPTLCGLLREAGYGDAENASISPAEPRRGPRGA